MESSKDHLTLSGQHIPWLRAFVDYSLAVTIIIQSAGIWLEPLKKKNRITTLKNEAISQSVWMSGFSWTRLLLNMAVLLGLDCDGPRAV